MSCEAGSYYRVIFYSSMFFGEEISGRDKFAATAKEVLRPVRSPILRAVVKTITPRLAAFYERGKTSPGRQKVLLRELFCRVVGP